MTSATNELWRLFNLRESPFFQEPLDTTPESKFPVSLFVGRGSDADRLLGWIGSHPGGSRNVVAGAPGTGKTTLVQHVKAQLESRRVIGSSKAVSLGPGDTENDVAVRIIDYVYRTILSRGDFTTHDNAAMEAARAMVRVFASRSYAGGMSAWGFGASASESKSFVTAAATAPTLMLEQLLPELLAFAREHVGAAGILVHLNNLEHLSDDDAARAAGTLRALRDRCLFLEGFHWLVVGTTDAVATVVGSHRQVKSVFPLWAPLAPLSADDVLALLARRYAHLRVDPIAPARDPVTPDAVRALYAVFAGDVRSTLQALDQATSELLGYASARADAALTRADIAPVLQHAYGQTLTQDLTEDVIARLALVAEQYAETPVVTRQLTALWRISQPAASTTLKTLVERGYLVAVAPRATTSGRPPMQYALTGAARLSLGLFSGEAPPQAAGQESRRSREHRRTD